MASFRKCVAEFLPGNNAHRLPEPVPSNSLPSRGRTASREHPAQCARQSVRFETVTNSDKRTKEREAQCKRHLSIRAAFAILSACSIVTDDVASSPSVDSV